MKRSELITIAIILLVLLFAGIFTYYTIEQSKVRALKESDANQALQSGGGTAAFTDMDGAPVSLTDYLGKKIVVQVWASWCPQCASQLIMLSEVAQTDQTGAVFLAVNRAEDPMLAKRFLRTLSIDQSVQLVLDPSDNFYENIDGFTMPETIIFNSDGTIKTHIRGEIAQEKLKQLLTE